MTIVAYELADRPAALLVDYATCSAAWRVVDREVAIADVLAIAPADVVVRLVRRSITEVRAAASGSPADGERLRRLAAAIWREFRDAEANVGEQTTLPGM